MSSIYRRRRGRLWARFKTTDGKWRGKCTPFLPGQEEEAQRFADALEGTAPTAHINRPTHVYFVQVNDGPIKIGCTSLPLERIQRLQNWSPYAMVVLLWVPGDRDLEQATHRKFGHLRLQGEWFSPGEDLLVHIRGLATHVLPGANS